MSHNPKIDTPYQAYEAAGKKIYEKIQEFPEIDLGTEFKELKDRIKKVIDDVDPRGKNKAATVPQRKG